MVISAAEWLKGNRDYNEGLEILKAAGGPGFVLNVLSTGPDHYNTPKLVREIELVAQRQAELHSIVPAPATSVKQKVTPETLPVPDANLEKKLNYDKTIRQLWKEICHLHGQLSVLPGGEQLYQAARELMVKNLKKQRLFDELHFFNTNGQWFDELPENQPKPENLEQEIKNAMANRAKCKKHLKQPQVAYKKAYYEGKVAEWDAKIEKLKTLRDGKEAAGAQGAA